MKRFIKNKAGILDYLGVVEMTLNGQDYNKLEGFFLGGWIYRQRKHDLATSRSL